MTLHYLMPRYINEMRMTATYPFFWGDGTEMLVEVDVYYIVCPKCHGKGRHVATHKKPSTEWEELSLAEVIELQEGKYDVPCERCAGKRVIVAIDEAMCGYDMLQQFRERDQQLCEAVAEIQHIAEQV